jgi:hypothetical protein
VLDQAMRGLATVKFAGCLQKLHAPRDVAGCLYRSLQGKSAVSSTNWEWHDGCKPCGEAAVHDTC